MSTRLAYILTALCGILATIASAIYYPNLIAPPPPLSNATVAQVTAFATQYHDAQLLNSWLQATGSFLTIIFFLALVHLSGAATRFAGRLTLLVGAVIMAVVLSEDVFQNNVVLATANGHPATALTSFDFSGAFVHVFPIAPSLILMLGIALLGTHLLPRVFSYLALILGIGAEILGLVGIFSASAITVYVFFTGFGQFLWVLATAITLLVHARKASNATAVKERETLGEA